MESEFQLRLATDEDVPALHALIEASVRGLQATDYTPAQIEGALGTVLGLDTQLIRDRTYFIAEIFRPKHESAERRRVRRMVKTEDALRCRCRPRPRT